jgi:photosystem II stability/assembly factor-like uncharacterized protein
VRGKVRGAGLLLLAGLAFGCTPGLPTGPGAPAPPACSDASTHGPNRSGVTASTEVGCYYPTGYQDITPSIQVSKEGDLFVARAKGGVLRSTDGGKTWTSITVPDLADGDSHANGTHGFVHLDPRTNRVYYVTNLDAASCGGNVGGLVSWSDDLGKTWTGKTVACDTYDWGKLITGPAPAGNAYPSAIYFLGVGKHLVGGERFVYRSLDGGATWQKMDKIASQTTEGGVGATAPDGTVYFDYPQFTGLDPESKTNPTYPYDPANDCRQMIAVSQDYGTTWRQVPIPNSQSCGEVNGQQRVAVDSAGTVYVVWADDKDAQLYLTYSKDKGNTWSTPVNVMAPKGTFVLDQESIVAGKPGHILIASLQTTAAERPGPTLGFVGIYAGPADAVLTESFDATAAQPTFTTADLDANGDQTLASGAGTNEGNAYLGMSPDDQGWAVFSRHEASTYAAGDLTAARLTTK